MYTPQHLPSQSLETFAQAVRDEFNRLALNLQSPVDFAILKTLYVEPTKKREGMLVKADGTTWNPGSGAGVYQYRGTTWNYLG